MIAALLWDIDGTLLTTARAGIFAWQDAFESVAGRRIDLESADTAGLTDVEIGHRLLAEHAVSAERISQLLGEYARRLPACLGRRQGHVMPGVIEILERVRARGDVVQLLLTGNLRACAFAKLAHYGLDGFFRDGSFADDAPDRAAQAVVALALVSARAPDLAQEQIHVVGDTPHDVRCARAIGVRTIAVATGPYTVPQLVESGADIALERLPDASTFERLITVGERSAR